MLTQVTGSHPRANRRVGRLQVSRAEASRVGRRPEAGTAQAGSRLPLLLIREGEIGLVKPVFGR
jgi:hypothetical protein